MKAVILLCLVGAALAAPGGYTGMGGVYKNMKMKDDVMSHAMKASKHLIIYNAVFLQQEYVRTFIRHFNRKFVSRLLFKGRF